MKGPLFLKVKEIYLVLSFFFLSACAGIAPKKDLAEEEFINLIGASVYKDESFRFASVGKLSIKSIMHSYDLNLKAVTRLKPFAMRVELYKENIIPIIVLTCQNEDWTLISYAEKTIYLGKASCNMPLGILDIPISKVALISILYGRPVIYDNNLILKGQNQVSIRSGNCGEIMLAAEGRKLHLRPIENNADLEITFLMTPTNTISLGPVMIEIGKFGINITYIPDLIKEDIDIPDELIEETLPPGFVIKSIDEIR